ncbi:MAG: tyrosine-type recombinase/integrase, partial [Planctomycetes bacterium]|nr:tyrosine-type recombinase/integrase [Planctomycetota bacterium]
MSVKATGPPRRGNRSPTAVWILSRRGTKGVSYRIRWVDPTTGQTQAKACGRDKALARIERDAKRAELREGLSGQLPNSLLSELESKMQTFMVGKSHHTIRKTRRSLKDLMRLCGDRRMEHVDRAMVMDFRARRLAGGVVSATVNKDLRQIKSALSYAVDAGWLRTNPLWRWKGMQLTEPERLIRVVEQDEFQALLKGCPNPTFRVLLIVAYYQGLRRTELVNLRWSAVDLGSGLLRVLNVAEANELTKSRKNRALPLRQVAKEQLEALYADVPKLVVDGEVRPKFPHCFTWDDGKQYRADWVTNEFSRIAKR